MQAEKCFVYWSFKGGAGRTMTLANLVGILTRLGKHVVCIDLDIEAPGLSVVLGASYHQEGFVEYAKEWIRTYPESAEAAAAIDLTIDDQLPDVDHLDGRSAGSIRLIRAGNYGEDGYWNTVMSNRLGFLFVDTDSFKGDKDESQEKREEREKSIETIERFWEHLQMQIDRLFHPGPSDPPPPDYIFVDTRTGLSPLSRASLKNFPGTLIVFHVDKSGNAKPTDASDEADLLDEARLGTRKFLETARTYYPDTVAAAAVSSRRPKAYADAYIGSVERERETSIPKWVGNKATEIITAWGTLESDPEVELSGKTLVPLQGEVTYRNLLDDYLRLAIQLFPEIVASGVEDPVSFLREKLGVPPHQKPEDIVIMELAKEGGMRNRADKNWNISFKVATFQLLLDELLSHIPSATDVGKALRASGREVGANFGESLREEVKDRGLTEGQLLEEWCRFDSRVGWGRLSAVVIGDQNHVSGGSVLVAQNAFAFGREWPGRDHPNSDGQGRSQTASGMSRRGLNDLCAFLSGYIEGVIGGLLVPTVAPKQEGVRREVSVALHEPDECIRGGKEVCTFQFTVTDA